LTDTKKYVSVGKLGKARGVSGEIYVVPMTDFPDRFLNLKEIHVGDRGHWGKMTIVSSRLIAGRPVLKFENIETPEEASRLTNRELAVTDDQLVSLPDDTFYLFDLVGCLIVDAATGDELGEVVDVHQYPANDVYVVKLRTGKEVLLPAVKRFVKHIDTEARRILVELSGMFDDDQASGD